MTGSSRLSCPGIVSGTTWCSIGQRREKGRVQQGGPRHCRISVKIRRLLRTNTQTWVLSSVAQFVYCAQTVCTLAKLGFQVFILCADVCLHPLIPARSGFCLCQLSLLCFGFVSYVLRQDIAFIAKKQFVFFACIFGRRSNGLKFRSGLPVAAILRCGSALATTSQIKGRFWGVENCSKTLPWTRGLHSAGVPSSDVGEVNAQLHNFCCLSLLPTCSSATAACCNSA